VISRAKQVLEQIAKNSHIATGLRSGGAEKTAPKSGDKSLKTASKPRRDFTQESQMSIDDLLATKDGFKKI